MTRKLLIGFAAVFWAAVTVSNPLMSVVLAVGVWIYVARTVFLKGDTVVGHRVKTRIKTLLTLAAISFVLFSVGSVVHSVLSGLAETEEVVFLLVSLFASWAVVGSTAVALALLLRERGKTE